MWIKCLGMKSTEVTLIVKYVVGSMKLSETVDSSKSTRRGKGFSSI